jgi:hypothetical protein
MFASHPDDPDRNVRGTWAGSADPDQANTSAQRSEAMVFSHLCMGIVWASTDRRSTKPSPYYVRSRGRYTVRKVSSSRWPPVGAVLTTPRPSAIPERKNTPLSQWQLLAGVRAALLAYHRRGDEESVGGL